MNPGRKARPDEDAKNRSEGAHLTEDTMNDHVGEVQPTIRRVACLRSLLLAHLVQQNQSYQFRLEFQSLQLLKLNLFATKVGQELYESDLQQTGLVPSCSPLPLSKHMAENVLPTRLSQQSFDEECLRSQLLRTIRQ